MFEWQGTPLLLENFLTLISSMTGRVFGSVFAYLVVIPVESTSSTIGLKICAITAGIKKYRSTVKKKRKKA